MRLQAVIFDMDGVIIDSEELWFRVGESLLSIYGIDYTEELRKKIMGMGSRETMELIKRTYSIEDSVGCLLEQRDRIVLKVFNENIIPLIPNAVEFIKMVSGNGYKTALASSSPQELIDLVINRLGLAGYFSAIVSGDRAERGKPYPDIYLLTAKELEVDNRGCLVLEDSPNGVKAAKNAGMKCIGITTNASREELREADLLVDSYGDLSIEKMMALFS
jgi:HAD superfamily hydrolase (TIGR01509 family)